MEIIEDLSFATNAGLILKENCKKVLLVVLTKKTYNKFMQIFGNKKERERRILNEILKANGIDIDNEE
jgi:hypothetical protein